MHDRSVFRNSNLPLINGFRLGGRAAWRGELGAGSPFKRQI